MFSHRFMFSGVPVVESFVDAKPFKISSQKSSTLGFFFFRSFILPGIYEAQCRWFASAGNSLGSHFNRCVCVNVFGAPIYSFYRVPSFLYWTECHWSGTSGNKIIILNICRCEWKVNGNGIRAVWQGLGLIAHQFRFNCFTKWMRCQCFILGWGGFGPELREHNLVSNRRVQSATVSVREGEDIICYWADGLFASTKGPS